jgi:hypothetical protein
MDFRGGCGRLKRFYLIPGPGKRKVPRFLFRGTPGTRKEKNETLYFCNCYGGNYPDNSDSQTEKTGLRALRKI